VPAGLEALTESKSCNRQKSSFVRNPPWPGDFGSRHERKPLVQPSHSIALNAKSDFDDQIIFKVPDNSPKFHKFVLIFWQTVSSFSLNESPLRINCNKSTSGNA